MPTEAELLGQALAADKQRREALALSSAGRGLAGSSNDEMAGGDSGAVPAPSLLEQARSALARTPGVVAGQLGQAWNAAKVKVDGPSLIDREQMAANSATETGGTGSVRVQTPEQAAAAAQAALLAGPGAVPGGARVVGMTRGGFQPATRSSQQQRERTELPPGYTEVASEELRQNRIQGETLNEQALLAEAVALKSAKVRGKIAEIQQFATQKAADDEDRAMQGAQDQIASALAEFKASGPQMITYRDIWDEADTGGKITLALGAIAGALGSRPMHGVGNTFLNQLDATIKRKIDIQEAESEKLGKVAGEAKSAYDVLKSRFRDKDVTRKMLHVIALQQFDQHVAEQAAQLGMGMGDARLAKMRGDLLNKQRGIMKELGSKIVEQQGQQDKYAPPQAITVGGIPSARGKEKPNEYELERIKLQLPKKQAAAKKLKELVATMNDKDRGFLENLARRKAAVDPGSWYEFFLRSDSPGKTQAMLQAVNTIVQDQGGKALTKEEASRYAASIINDGSPEGIARGAEYAQQLINADEEALHSAFPEQYREGNLRRGIYRNIDQPHELEGLSDQPDFNKRVISP